MATAKKKDDRRNILGPGLITGASDDDPSGIATYSQVGAQFGTGMLWTMPLTYPLMSGIQEITARIARVTGHGLAGNLRRSQDNITVAVLVSLLVAANTINLGADLAAMGAAAAMLAGGPSLAWAGGFALVSLTLQVLVPYRQYARYLKWLTLALLAYVATAFTLTIPWSQVLADTFVPRIALNQDSLAAFVAVLGTTISPYLFFWQASEEREEQNADPRDHVLRRAPQEASRQFHRIEVDTYIGMFISNAVAYFIILTCALTLHQAGIRDINSADQAAEALRPLAGPLAFSLFAVGIIGTGLLAVPVLAGSAGYAVAEAVRWPNGLGKTMREAPRFYGVIAGLMILGFVINAIGVDPIRALYLAAILNGLIAPILQVYMMRMATDRAIMGQFVLRRRLRVTGWIVTAVMGTAAAALLVSLVL